MQSPDTYGPNLVDYIERHLASDGLTVNAWTDRTPGVTGADFTRWRAGTEPRIEKYRAVAAGLKMSVVDVLLAAGVLGPEDVGDGHKAPQPAAPSVDVAIDRDPTLTDLQRRSLRDILAALRRAEAGAGGTTGKVSKRVTRR